VTACAAGPGGPGGSFDPQGPCDVDGIMAGAYPELEARLPDSFDGRPPDELDSGRHCTPDALGTLTDEGYTELRFAGATWDMSAGRALAIAVFEAPNLTPDLMLEFYEDGARRARRADRVETSDTLVGGVPGRRLDVLYSGTGQTVVTWPGEAPNTVNVMLASELGDGRVLEILEVLGAR
jgi:hypothetical protein